MAEQADQEGFEACVFPSLRDTEWEDLAISELIADAAIQFCNKTATKPRIFAAGLWSIVLRQFTGVDTPQIWFTDPSETESGSKTNLMRTSLAAGMTFEDLLDGCKWAAGEVKGTGQSNIGVVVLGGENSALLLDESVRSLKVCEVVLSVQDCAPNRNIRLSYRPTFLSRFSAVHLVGTIEHLMLSILKDPTQRLDQILLSSVRDRRQISDWASFSFNETQNRMYEFVRTLAEREPAVQAVDAWDGCLTYSQLDEVTSKVASRLRDLEVRPGILVPVCFEKSQWAIVAMLAVNKAGGAFVPLDHSQPLDRLKNIIGKTGANLILTSINLAQSIHGIGENVITISEALVRNLPPVNNTSWNPAQGSDPAYCLFTSGSTGEPKGCVVSQSAFAGISHHSSKLHIASERRVLQFASFSFGIGLIEVFCTLSAGATVCIPSDKERMNSLANVISSMNIDWVMMTPTALESLHPREVPTLKNAIVAGEPVQQAQIALWADTVYLCQAYGLTEWAGICGVSQRVTSGSMKRNIGFPANGNFWLVDPADHNRLSPIGAIGELVIQGPNLAEGYLNDSERMAAVFISEPAWMQDVGLSTSTTPPRLYKTGDLVRYNSNGSINYVGRKDTQTKIRGQRVELGEVESHLRQLYPESKAVVAEVATPRESKACLVAFILPKSHNDTNGVVTTNGNPDTVSDIVLAQPNVDFSRHTNSVEQSLKNIVPSYMVPAIFLPLRRIPRTITGKTDRRRLRGEVASLSWEQLKPYRSDSSDEKRALSTETEKELGAIFARLFGLSPEKINASDGFQMLGGDSVMAMRVVAKARAAGIGLAVSDILGSASISTLAERASKVGNKEVKVEKFGLVDEDARMSCVSSLYELGMIQNASEVEDVMPAMENQDFLIDRFALDHFCFLLNGPIDIDRLQEACRAVIRKYSVLRTIFTEQQDRLFQVVLQDIPNPLQRMTATCDLEETCGALVDSGPGRLVHLDKIATQFTLISSSETKHALDFRLSHAQHDAFSVPLLFNDVAAAYDGSSLSPAVPYSSYVHYRTQQEFTAGYDFWRRYLDGSSITRLKALESSHNIPAKEAEIVISPFETLPLPIPPAGVTLASMMNAAWAYLLSELTSSSDLVFGQTVNGRNLQLPGIDTILGPCINFVPFRTYVPPDWTVSQFLHHVQGQYMQIANHDYLDMANIVKRSTDWPSGSNFGFVFQHQNVDIDFKIPFRDLENPSCLRSLKIRPQPEIWVFSFPRTDDLLLNVRGASNALDPATASSIVKKMRSTVEAFVQYPNTTLSDLRTGLLRA